MGRYTGRSGRLVLMCFVSAILFVVEMAVGYIGNSLSLASDAFAVLSHLISMVIGLVGVRYSRVEWHKRNTFGFPRADVVGAFGNSVFATALMFSILVEAIKRFVGPQKTEEALLVLIVGLIGLLLNFVNYVIFLDCCYCDATSLEEEVIGGDTLNIEDGSDDEESKKEVSKAAALNIRGVLLHVMGDALGSVIVVITATIFYIKPLPSADQCNWQCYIDPSLTLVMVIIILASAFPLIKETATILLQMVPKGVDVQEIGEKIKIVPGVGSIHEVHVWELAGGRNVASLHVKCKDPSDYQTSTKQMRKVFHDAGIHSVTIQPEFTDLKDISTKCNSACISSNCDSQLCCSQKEMEDVECNGHVDGSSHNTDFQYKMNGIKKGDIEPSVGYLCEGGVSEKGKEEQAEVEILYGHKF
ncbi:calcium/manganese antiporter SLC30A10 isoform X2 [Pleurodeles waltl]|uniref:calcium/manganese antiporter SLC30A10 isoform X2 n=1 Tax=Pleurodeles waltl TaxID=8319 RepID=UPI0037099698